MISYELAKKLKQMGFPKENFIITEPNSKYPNQKGQKGTPTLSELIEVCEKITSDSIILSNNYIAITDGGEGDKWFAGKYNFHDSEWVIVFAGNSPEEAVANLWLELNNKI